MAWTAPLTANTDDDFVANWENGDSARSLYVVRPLAVIADTVEVSNTIEDNDLFTPVPVLPGGWLGTKGMLRGTAMISLLNRFAPATATNFTFRLKLGATDLWKDETAAIGYNDKSTNAYQVRFWLANCGAANSQFCTGYITATPELPATTGVGDLTDPVLENDGPFVAPFGTAGKPAVDTSVDQTVRLTVAPGRASSDVAVRMHWGTVELIGQTA